MYKNNEYWTLKDWNAMNTVEIGCAAIPLILLLILKLLKL